MALLSIVCIVFFSFFTESVFILFDFLFHYRVCLCVSEVICYFCGLPVVTRTAAAAAAAAAADTQSPSPGP